MYVCRVHAITMLSMPLDNEELQLLAQQLATHEESCRKEDR